MAAALKRAASPPELNEQVAGDDATREFVFTDTDFRSLSQLAYEHAGIVLSDHKRNLVYSRLSRRLRVLGLSAFKQYRDYLADNEHEIEAFINSISTNHTKFFREAHHFDHLRGNLAVPFAKATGASGRKLRIWSAGCSSGEEPYTIAVVLKREIRDIERHDVRILATDIDTDIVTKAARGEYAGTAIDDIPEPYREFFRRDDTGAAADKMQVARSIRAMIAFKQLNLMKPWPFSGLFDAIFCRNVMIYFDAATKAALVGRFTRQLKPGGWLYIGHSESLIGGHPGLQLLGRTIYRRDP